MEFWILGLTLWVHSLDGSQFNRRANSIFVLCHDPEQVHLSLHDAHTLTFG